MRIEAALLTFTCALLIAAESHAQLIVTNTRALAFGKFVAGAGGTVTVHPSGMRTATGGVVLLTQSGGASAAFNISDNSPDNTGSAYIITLPADDTVVLSNGSSSMTVSNFVSSPSGSGLLGGGSQILSVGATLSVPSRPTPGAYSGSFSVIVNYQ